MQTLDARHVKGEPPLLHNASHCVFTTNYSTLRQPAIQNVNVFRHFMCRMRKKSTRCITLLVIATHGNTLQHAPDTWCTTCERRADMQHTAARCNTLQQDDVWCTTCQKRAVNTMGWLWFVGSMKLQFSFAKEPYKRDYILQKRPII